jgi:cellulose synthase/poly-beta-1,6-N-acetylglucosamine synthase-like glycosyltransferase
MTQSLFFWCLSLLNIALFSLAIIYSAQLLAALPSLRAKIQPSTAPRPKIAILVPAHNEEAGLGASLTAIRAAMAVDDRLLVVADNCSDRTAIIAQTAGAEVLERNDTTRRGKGYALDAGVKYLSSCPPDIVVLIDADCFPSPDAIGFLAEATVQTERPVQALYLMTNKAGAGLSLKIAELAFMLKNRLRQRGLNRLGIPCHLTGSGMAFRWEVISDLDLAHGHLVEDMKMGLDLAIAGSGPVFCEDAVVLSPFPDTVQGLSTQRQRWIGGHFELISTALTGVARALRRGRIAAALSALSTAIPPLTFLLPLLAITLLMTAGFTWALKLAPLPLLIAAANLALVCGTTLIAWVKYGRSILTPSDALRAVSIIGLQMIRSPQMLLSAHRNGWVRTDRGQPGE